MYRERITAIEMEIREFHGQDSSGHDWQHIERVRSMALHLQKAEGGDPFIIEATALLHDLDDWKLGKEENEELHRTKKLLTRLQVESSLINQLCEIIKTISFKGAGEKSQCPNIEAEIVQDADRLDAIGAIGIARAFAFGGNRNRALYIPEQKANYHASFEEYKKDEGHTIKHFYEKLLLLKDRMNTPTAKKIAQERHAFMEVFLEQFFEEWKIKS